MNYLLFGTEKYLIEKEIKKIIEKSKINEINISKYNLEIDSIENIIDDLNTVSLFSDKKLIVIDNSFIFSKIAKKINNMQILENYLKNPINDNIVIFVNNSEKIDNTKKIVKLIKDNGIIKEFNVTKNLVTIVKNMFDDYVITNDNINFLIDRVGNNLEIINQEIEKLKIYKCNDKIILREDINSLTCENINLDIFRFIDDIINENKTNVIKTYNELLKRNEEPIKIIALLESKFRLIYQACNLQKKGYSEDEISSLLNVHKYPVHLAINAGYKYSDELLLKYMLELSELDSDIKSGIKDSSLALELFLLKI